MKSIRQLLILCTVSLSLWSCSSYTEEEISKTVTTADSLKSNTTIYWQMIQQNDSIIFAGMYDFLNYGKETALDPMVSQKLQIKISQLEKVTYPEPTNIPSFDQVGTDDDKVDLLIKEIFTYLSALPDSTSRLSVLEFKTEVDKYYYEQLAGIRGAFSKTSKEYNDYITTKEDVLDEGDYDLTPIKNFFPTNDELEKNPEQK